jgi:pilus assembly protein CpaF
MSLRELILSNDTVPVMGLVKGADMPPYYKIKSKIHNNLLQRVDLEALATMKTERLRDELATLVKQMLLEEGVAMNALEHQRMIEDIQNEVMGLGPLEPLLADPSISDILVNGPKQV